MLVELDNRRWQETVRKLAEVNRVTVQRQLAMTARLVVEDAIAMTPPIPKGGFGKGNAGTRERTKTGQKAVERDIRKTMMPAASMAFLKDTGKDNRAGRNMRRYLRTGDLDKARTLMERLGIGGSGGIHPKAERWMHEGQRSNGYVRRRGSTRYIIQDATSIAAYVKERIKMVWKGVSGWNKAAAALKARSRYWPAAAKGFHEPGHYATSPKSSDDVYYEFANQSPYMQRAGRNLRVMEYAFSGVEGRLRKDLEFKLAMAHKQAKS